MPGWPSSRSQPKHGILEQYTLELGRGLVLHSATSVADLPELLSSAGHTDLAQEWRGLPAARRDAPWEAPGHSAGQLEALLASAQIPEVPSDLRSRTLDVLAGTPEGGRLLAPPSPAEIAAALALTGTDALVYLLPPAGDRAGLAVLVPAADVAASPAPEPVPLPLLHQHLAGALDGYVVAHEAVLALSSPVIHEPRTPQPAQPRDPVGPPDPAGTAKAESGSPPRCQAGAGGPASAPGPQAPAHTPLASPEFAQARQRWQRALTTLCEWAWPTVMQPLLDRAGALAG